MTTEHKILVLVDRGFIHISDMCALVGNGAKREGKRMHDRGLTRFTRPGGCYLSLTSDGVQRLNSLDEAVAKGMVH